MNKTHGILIVIAGPSGAGKTTLSHHLVSTFPRTRFSVSTTTRLLRGDEEDGADYFFVSKDEFNEKKENDYFLEYAEVHGYYYGTSKQWVEEQLCAGNNVVLDIDVQGAVQVKTVFSSAILIFVLTPSPAVLLERLETRCTDSPETISKRMEGALGEVRWLSAFDYYIRNNGIDDAKAMVETIFRGEKLRLQNLPYPGEAMEYDPGTFEGREVWKGKKVIVTSGPTREPVDDVRFISNRSSGLMGRGLAAAFRDAGADVTLISGPVCSEIPSGLRVVLVDTAEEMLEAVREKINETDLLVMAAAVSDFRPVGFISGKISRDNGITLSLESTPDILCTLSSSIPESCFVLAFALEFGDNWQEKAMSKLKTKRADAIFCNRGDQGDSGMESPGNRGVLFFPDGSSYIVRQGAKRYVAEIISAALGRRMIEKND
ncbi:MAG: guanylate kinase [FCB group bacterium]|nr:guanylate kinase [FCB group bacterium]